MRTVRDMWSVPGNLESMGGSKALVARCPQAQSCHQTSEHRAVMSLVAKAGNACFLLRALMFFLPVSFAGT